MSAILEPLILPQRLERIDHVVRHRTGHVVPVLDHLCDPHNTAAVLRSADAFGVQHVYVVDVAADEFAASAKVASGAERWVDVHRYTDSQQCVQALKAQGYSIAVASMEGQLSPRDLRNQRVAVVFGNEHIGVQSDLRAQADITFRIPMCGFVESLNVSVAVAITLSALTEGVEPQLTNDERETLRARFMLASVREGEAVVAQVLERAQRAGGVNA